ncbi:hypothetical protein JCGZ_20886 [Jatropha curcas]|uniref:NB-ARC domain-containing protein n=1 Tax=Jatropha curcas TaxID=180498 RepID=A0A067L5Y4_JATCU|nr:hypothetical protein JCGZ_20886 [Jatropha curcas]
MLSFPRTTNPYMARQTVLSVLGKILNLLIQESDSLLEFDDRFQWIEAQLQKYADLEENVLSPYVLIEIMYDIEDLIDELIIRSAQRRSGEAIIRCILSLVDLPRQFFYVLALIDLTDSYRFYKKLELIKVNISRIFSKFFQSGYWHNTFSPYDLEIGTTIVSPVISKFEALVAKRQLKPPVRTQARLLRDEFKSLKVFLKDLESQETISEKRMAWIEQLCDVCRSAKNVVGLFLTKKERVSFEEDVDAVIKQLLKDNPRCLTISIVGVKGIGKTRLVKFIYESQIILDNFPHRIWVDGSTEFLSKNK